MRRSILAILAVLLIAPAIRAADPAPPAGAPAAGQHPTRILVLPFSMTGAEAKYAWIGQAISENFQAELAKSGFAIVNPTNPDGAVAVGDADKALRVAQNSRAEVVIFGSYQFLDPDLRVTGQIVDVQSNQVVGVLKASGTFRQLFTIEDDLADQSRKFLMGDKVAGKEEVLEPRPPLAPTNEPYDTNTTAQDDHREYKLPYAEQPAAVYDDDYLGLGYTSYYYPAYYRPRVYSFIGYSNYGYYYPYAYSYPCFFPTYYDCWYPRSYWGSGLFLSFGYSHWSGNHWGGWNGWSGHHWDGHWDGRGPRFGDRPRSIMAVNNGPAGHDFFHGTLTSSRFTTVRDRPASASRVINVDRERTTVTDRTSGRTQVYNHAGAQLADSTRRYSHAGNDEVTIRRPSPVDARTSRRADSDSRVASDRVWDRSNPDGARSRDTARSRETDSPRVVRDEPSRVRETPRDTPRENSRSRDYVPSGDGNRFREPARFDPPASRSPDRGSGGSSIRDSSPRGGDSGSRGGGGGGGGGGSRSSGGGGGGGGGSGSRSSGGGSSGGGGGGHAGAGFGGGRGR